MNQPPRGAALKKIEPERNTPPSTKHQKPKAESRGNGRSRAPSICGRKITAMASKIGIANRNIITEPCTVKTWLYVSAESTSALGRASCARIKSASTPANRKNKQQLATYHTPTSLLFTDDQ